MDKKDFIKELKKAYASPKKYFNIKDGNCDVEKLNSFFQSFVDSYLNSSVKGITDQTPTIEFKSFKDIPTKVNDPTGKYEQETNSIVMNVDRFSGNKSENQIRKTIVQVMAIVCHEHQHYKQFAYVDFNKKGETEKANAMKQFLGVPAEKIEQDAELGSFTYDELNFMKKVMPESVQRIQSKTNPFTRKGEQSIKDAFYFRRAVEVDARETSLPIFGAVANDVLKSGSLGLGLKMKKMQVEQWGKNFKDMHRQGAAVMDTFEEEVKKISPEHFIKYSEIIDKQIEENNNSPEAKNAMEQDKYTFDETLKATSIRLGKDETIKFLQELVEKSPEGSYARQAASEKLEELSKPTVTKVSTQEIEEEGYYKNEQQNQITRTKNERTLRAQAKGTQENISEMGR